MISLKSVLSAALAAALLAGSSAWAQTDTGKTARFNIPAGDLAAALKTFGEQSGTDVLFDPKLAAAKQTKGLSGEYEAGEGLRRLLNQTNLKFRLIDGNTVLVESAEAGAADPQSVQPNAAGTTAAAGSPVAVTGKITDSRSGANLKGAFVTLEETGQGVATDDLGNFRFVGVKPGVYQLHISYLGFADVTARLEVAGDADIRRDFSLSGGNELNAMVVFGSRSARAQALNQERTAENVSTVISSDLLGDFTGTTLSETLRRVPGVIFERNTDTGDGANIVIRGLAPDFNTVKFNSIELPEGNGTGRSATLSNVLTESISKVTISKTLLPNQDSAGTGGLVEIETKTPFDRPRRYASFTVEGAGRDRGFNRESIASGTVSGLFGAESQFGLGASLQYRDRTIKRAQYSASMQYGRYMPLQVDGTPSIVSPDYMDPRTPFPFEPGAADAYPYFVATNLDMTETSNRTATLSGAWAVNEHTQLFLDYQRLEQNDTIYRTQSAFNATMGYSVAPVAALGGEVRRVLGWGDDQRVSATPLYTVFPDWQTLTNVASLRGKTETGPWQFKYLLGHTKGTTSNTLLDLILGFDQSFAPEYISPAAIDPVEDRVLSPFGARVNRSFPVPLLTPAGFAFLNDENNYTFSRGDSIRYIGRNERRTGELGARYDFTGQPLKYLDVGVNYESSEFADSTSGPTEYYDSVAPTSLAQVGLQLTGSSLSDIGVNSGVGVVNRRDLERFLRTGLPALATDCSLYDPANPCPPDALIAHSVSQTDPALLREYTRENEFATYLQARVDIGKLEIIGGARMTRVEIDAVNLNEPSIVGADFQEDFEFRERNRGLKSDRATQTQVLPRVLMNYRQSDNLVLRAGYYLSVARPQISLISGTPGISLTLYSLPEFGIYPRLFVSKGNPDLKPARTHSFDIGAEYYDENIGAMKLGVFYKRIENLLESNVSSGAGGLSDVTLPDDPRFQDVIDNPQNYQIEVYLPFNNDSPAHIGGVEASIEKQFTFLPAAWSGLGVYANYTYTESSKKQPASWWYSPVLDGNGAVTGYESVNVVIPDVRFNGQAKHSGTFGLTYNRGGIDASLAYTAQGRRMTSFNNNNLSAFEEAYGTLDLRAEYRFDLGPGKFRVYLEGADLLRGPDDPSRETSRGAGDGATPKFHDSGSYFGGRQLRLGVATTF